MADRSLVVKIVGDDRQLSRTLKHSTAESQKFERSIGKSARGALAGSGAFKSLGRSLAFASGGFLAFASAGELLRKSVDAATEATKAQRQLGAQFRASGLDLKKYDKQIVDASLATSRLSGFTETELTDAFTQAFRGSQSVSVGLRIQSIAADVARGRHLELSKATIALTKAYGGQATALKRLGIQVPANLHGMAALEFVARRFAGQARAGTTAQQRFAAALHNTEVSIGSALLPMLTKYLNKATKWLDNSENQKKIQKDVTKGVHLLASGLNTLGSVVKTTDSIWQHYGGTLKTIFKLTQLASPLSFIPALKKAFGGGGDKRPSSIALTPAGFVRGTHGLAPSTRENPGGFLTPAQVRARGLDPTTRGQAPSSATNPSGFLPLASAAAAAKKTIASGPPGLHRQFQLSLLKLAQVQVTATEQDDRRVLNEQARIIHAAIRLTSNLKKRTALYQQLGSIENQIRAIDDKRRQAEKDANAKEIAAQKKFRDRIDAQNRKLQAHFKAMNEAFLQRQKVLREALKTATENVRSELGGLPFPDVSASKGILGVKQPGIGTFTQSIHNQTSQLVGFFKDLNRLGKRGAPGQFLTELRAGGVQNAAFVHTLATSSGASLKKLFREVAKQEKVVQQIAHADVHAQTVVVHARSVQMGGGRGAATAVATRRGRQAGVPLSIGSYIGG